VGLAAAPQTHVELYGFAGTADRWDVALWDTGVWAQEMWRRVDCLITSARVAWGADDTLGCLVQSAAGVWQIRTHDPGRDLDPSNPTGAYRFLTTAGTPIRLLYGAGVLRVGYLDELRYNFSDSTGELDGSDAIAVMAQCVVPATWRPTFTDPSAFTLYSLARQALAAAGLSYIPVAATPAGGDLQVAFRETEGQNVWQLIREAATDALQLAYMTWDGTLAFASFSDPAVRGYTIGDDGICPVDLTVTRTERGIVNLVSDGAGEVGRDQLSIDTYGPRAFRVDRREPGSTRWGAAIIADRAAAGMEYEPGELRPETVAQLTTMARAIGNELVVVNLTSADRAINVDTQYLGGSIAFDAGGDWRGEVRLYRPGIEYEYSPPTATTPGTGILIELPTVADTTLYLSNGVGGTPIEAMGAGAGSGANIESTARTAGDVYANARLLARWEPDWTGARRYRRARLRLYVKADYYDATHPKTIDVRRVIGTWSEGVQTAVSPYNASVWPGPPTTLVGRVVAAPSPALVVGATYDFREWDITELYRSYVPRSLGGAGLPDVGLMVLPGAENIDSKLGLGTRESSLIDYAPTLLLDVEV
jgi:hypothetical protein